MGWCEYCNGMLSDREEELLIEMSDDSNPCFCKHVKMIRVLEDRIRELEEKQ